MYPEAEFESIRVQHTKKSGEIAWEIYLKEKGREWVPLSKSGSGIKTIILVLLNLIVVFRQSQNIGKSIVYGFEELENNLHPVMQRKLFDYIYKFAVEKNIYVFITTHSHVAINKFCDREKACIYHVVKENEGATIKRIEYILRSGWKYSVIINSKKVNIINFYIMAVGCCHNTRQKKKQI